MCIYTIHSEAEWCVLHLITTYLYTYPAAHSHVVKQMVATPPLLPRRMYTIYIIYIPDFMDGFILQQT